VVTKQIRLLFAFPFGSAVGVLEELGYLDGLCREHSNVLNGQVFTFDYFSGNRMNYVAELANRNPLSGFARHDYSDRNRLRGWRLFVEA
jgi:hypothetical protein